ncbi:MAG: glutathione transferase GstA [Gammaproteobacteria bacterium]|nr:glutathione transferase GstA [Gammaproteobacteria bacterium]
MKLYFSPGACSLAPHIVLHELGLPFQAVKTNTRERSTSDGSDFLAVNPKGYVPALLLDSGESLTECPAILQYLADRRPGSGLLPPAGTMAYYRTLEWLAFTATELHKGLGPIFRPGTPEDLKASTRERIAGRFDFVAGQLAGRDFAVGTAFTIADAYLYVVIGWMKPAGLDRERWPVLRDYHARIGARPAVRAARQAEGLPA